MRKIKNRCTGMVFLLLLSSPLIVLSQNPGGKKGGREKIILLKIEYMRENMGLTEAENSKFLPLYEEFLRKEEALRSSKRQNGRRIKKELETLSDAEIEKSIQEDFSLSQQLLDLEKASFEKYKRIIPMKKIISIKLLEREFNKMLMEKLKGKKMEGRQPPPGKE